MSATGNVSLGPNLTPEAAERIYALEKAKIGHRTLALSARLHYALGNTASQIVAVLGHLLRELKHTTKYKSPGPGWPPVRKKLRRLIRDAIALCKAHGDLSQAAFASRRNRIHARLQSPIAADWQDKNARRLIKRLKRHQNELLTFLDQLDVPFDNNRAEREIRPAVLMRKTSYCDRGAETQEILMTVLRTPKQRGHQPLELLPALLASDIATGQLPQLPRKITPDE